MWVLVRIPLRQKVADLNPAKFSADNFLTQLRMSHVTHTNIGIPGKLKVQESSCASSEDTSHIQLSHDTSMDGSRRTYKHWDNTHEYLTREAQGVRVFARMLGSQKVADSKPAKFSADNFLHDLF